MPINSGAQQGGGGLSALMQMVQMFNKSGDSKASTKTPQGTPSPQQDLPQAPDATTAIDRRAQAASEHPDTLIANGIDLMHEHGGNWDWDTAHSIIQPLLQAKYFGTNPMPDQGKVQSGQMGSGNAGSVIGAVAALV